MGKLIRCRRPVRNRGVPPRYMRSQIAAHSGANIHVGGFWIHRIAPESCERWCPLRISKCNEPFVLTHDFAASISSADCIANACAVFAAGLTIALRPQYEAMGKPRCSHRIRTASRQLPTCICHRAALRHQPLGAQGANLLLPPVRLELPGCRQQGCRARRSRRGGDRRREPAALQHLR